MSLSAQSGWRPISRLRTHEQVLAEIEERLREGSLRIGDRLPAERHLAETLGVSRSSVREALRVLEGIGVLESGPGSGPLSGSTVAADGVGGLAKVLRIHAHAGSFSLVDLTDTAAGLAQVAASRAAAAAHPHDTSHLESQVRRMIDAETPKAMREPVFDFWCGVGDLAGSGSTTALLAATLDLVLASDETSLDSPVSLPNRKSTAHAHDTVRRKIAEHRPAEAAELTMNLFQALAEHRHVP